MRYPDWTQRLQQTLKAAIERPFSWGEHDCCTFVADCCVAVCGVDPAEDYRGRYSTERGAARVVQRGHGSIAAVLDARFARVEPAKAQRGDVVLYDGKLGETAGVVWVDGLWSVGPEGVGRVNAKPKLAWRVE